MSPRTPGAIDSQPSLSGALLLVDIVELKWLLAGYGVRLHVERLQSDQEYARRVLTQALAVPHAALHAAAARVRRGLGLDEG